MSFVLGCAVIAFLPLPLLFMRDRPQDIGLTPFCDDGTARSAAESGGNPIRVAFEALASGARKRDFWLMAGGYFVCGATTNGLIGTHLIPFCVDHGLTEVTVAGLLATTGIFAPLAARCPAG